MNKTTAGSLVFWSAAVLLLATLAGSLALLLLDLPQIDSVVTAQLPWFLNLAVAGVLGLMVARRRPRNPTGWLLVLIGVFNGLYLLGFFAAIWGLRTGSPPNGWVEWPAWVYNWTGAAGAGLLLVLVFFFPDGRLPSPAWRVPAWILFSMGLCVVVASAIDPTPVQLTSATPALANPMGLAPLPAGPGVVVSAGFPIAFLAGVMAAVVVRFRRTRGIRRRQLYWFAYVGSAAVATALAGLALGAFSRPLGTALTYVGFDFGIGVGVPLTIGLAIVRYGLYDIDALISRTLAYGILAVLVAAVYVGMAAGVGLLVGRADKPSLALSILATAVVAVAFQPARVRVERLANRLVYGRRASPYEVLAEFAGRAAGSYDEDSVLPQMARVLGEGTGAELAEVWLCAGGLLQRAAAWPSGNADPPPVRVMGQLLPAIGAGRAVAVSYQGELLGALAVTKQAGEPLTQTEARLMDDLAHQASLLLKNVGLTADLRSRLAELRASRQRLVEAQDEERRRIERDLHDGAQQHLVALKLKLQLAQTVAATDPEKALASLGPLKGDADRALSDLRDLARGIYPPLLADQGLGPALRSQAGRATIPVTVVSDGVGRQPPEVEAAVYFSCLEALQNVEKYAAATRATITLSESAGRLRFEIADDGRGFDAHAVQRGSGLTNIADRLEALGGRLKVRSEHGAGTVVEGAIPANGHLASDAHNRPAPGINGLD